MASYPLLDRLSSLSACKSAIEVFLAVVMDIEHMLKASIADRSQCVANLNEVCRNTTTLPPGDDYIYTIGLSRGDTLDNR